MGLLMKATKFLEDLEEKSRMSKEYFFWYKKAIKESLGNRIEFNRLMTEYREFYLKGIPAPRE
jgi:hypothetical protein